MIKRDLGGSSCHISIWGVCHDPGERVGVEQCIIVNGMQRPLSLAWNLVFLAIEQGCP